MRWKSSEKGDEKVFKLLARRATRALLLRSPPELVDLLDENPPGRERRATSTR